MSPKSSRHRWRSALLGLGAILLLLVGLWWGGKAWLLAYLHGPEFRSFLNARLGATLQAEVDCAPLQFNGFDVYCETIRAQGYETSAFARAEAEQVRTRFSLRRFFSGAWTLDHLNAARLRVQLDGSRLAAPADLPLRASKEGGRGWLPDRLEIAAASVNQLELAWGDLPAETGGLRGVAVRAVPSDGGWNIDGNGGELAAVGLPTLDVVTLQLRQRRQTLFVSEARFADRQGGTARTTGEVRFGEQLDLQGQFDGVDLAPFLASDWRMRLHGRMRGEVSVRTPLPITEFPEVSGSLRLDGARIEALPVLNAIATFTRNRELRQLPLSNVTGDFRRKGERLEVRQLIAESPGRLRLEGGFTLEDGQIDGNFLVGLPAGTLAWLPGAQEKVFTIPRDSYLCAPLHLSGPVEAPTEDLSTRLATAAGETVIDELDQVTREAIETGKEATRRALDLLRPFLR